jgi:hypothetical protein
MSGPAGFKPTTENQNKSPSEEGTVPSTAPPATQSFNSVISNILTTADSSSTRVQDFFVTPCEEESQYDEEDVVSSCELPQDSQDLSQQSFPDNSHASGSQRKKRKRRQSIVASQKRRRKAQPYVYPTNEFIKWKPKPRWVTPPDMLDVIHVKIRGQELEDEDLPNAEPELPHADEVLPDGEVEEPNGERKLLDARVELRDAQAGAGDMGEMPATTHHELDATTTTTCSRDSPAEVLNTRKRGRSTSSSQDDHTDGNSDAKRSRRGLSTPPHRERSSSVHFVEVTPGNGANRRDIGSSRTDTPEAEAMISMSQQALAETESDFGSTVAISTYNDDAIEEDNDIEVAQITSQIEETQIALDDDVDDAEDSRSVRETSPALSLAPSQASSQRSVSSSLSSFTVSAFKDVMARFVEQIKMFVNGGNPDATEIAARQMAEEANKTVERLARVARRNEPL